MNHTAKQIETLAAWHAEQANMHRILGRRYRGAEKKERAQMLAAHHADAEHFLRALVGSLHELVGG